MKKYRIYGYYEILEEANVEANTEKEAIELAKKQIGRSVAEYNNVRFEVEQDFI